MIWIVVVVALCALAYLFIVKQKQAQKAGAVFLFRKQPVLFTPAERSFLGVLDQAIGKDFRLFGKVRVGDVLVPRVDLSKSARQTALNKINRKHFDYLLCNPGDLSVVCAIELNDKSHQQKHRQDRDAFLRDACLSAALPLIMFDAQRTYSVAEVSAKIAEALKGPAPKNVEQLITDLSPPSEMNPAAENNSAPLCPRCSSSMTKRTAKGGENAGREFCGCSNFPKCREVVAD